MFFAWDMKQRQREARETEKVKKERFGPGILNDEANSRITEWKVFFLVGDGGRVNEMNMHNILFIMVFFFRLKILALKEEMNGD